MRPPLALIFVALVLTACSWFGGTSDLLAPITGTDEAALEKAASAAPGAKLCGISTSDGLVRMLAKRSAAVVRADGRTRKLKLTMDQGTAGKTYAGDGVNIDLSFVADLLDKSGQVIGHTAVAMVRTPSGSEHFYGLWDC